MPMHPDWLILGAGLTGAALAYELQGRGQSVLLLDRHANVSGASRHSYGGVPDWAAVTPLQRQWFAAGRTRLEALSRELPLDFDYRRRTLLLAVDAEDDPTELMVQMAAFEQAPIWLEADAARAEEPLLSGAIAGAFRIDHGQVEPAALVEAYRAGLVERGGQFQVANIERLLTDGRRVLGVRTQDGQDLQAGQTVVAAGADSKRLLHQLGVRLPLFHSQADLLETEPTPLTLRTLVMGARLRRFGLEARAAELNWDRPDPDWPDPILDPGALQFRDGHLRLGQISALETIGHPLPSAAASEAAIRAAIARWLPALADLPARWVRCPVSFSTDQRPFCGRVPDWERLALFCGFSSPFVLVPSLAAGFADAACGGTPLPPEISPARFS